MEIASAAIPSNTFCENFTIVLISNARSPTTLPEATTAPVVSILPPSQAPVTSSGNPNALAMYGMAIIIGIAVINTIDTTYDSFLESPLMAPDVAMAADTPQIDTALEIIIVSSSSTLNLRHSQNAKYHTDKTTMSDWTNPSDPAVRISEKITRVPNSTNPILTSSSAFNESRNHCGSLKKLPTSRPIMRLKMTVSNPKSFKKALPERISAPIVSKKTNGNPTNWDVTDLPVMKAPMMIIT